MLSKEEAEAEKDKQMKEDKRNKILRALKAKQETELTSLKDKYEARRNEVGMIQLEKLKQYGIFHTCLLFL